MSFQKIDAKGDKPEARGECAMAVIGKYAYLFGGTRQGKSFDDFYQLDTEKWEWKKIETTGNKPDVLHGHSMTAVGNKLYIIGGIVLGGEKSSFVYVLDVDTFVFSKIGASGSFVPRSHHTATLYQNKIIIFGGDGVTLPDTTLVVFDTEKNEFFTPTQKGDGPPDPRKGATASLARGNKLLIYSGWGSRSNEYLKELLLLEIENDWNWKKVPPKGQFPAARGGACSAVFTSNNVLRFFVWGGYGVEKVEWNECHFMELNGVNWLTKKIFNKLPAYRFYFGHSVLNETKQLQLIFGGRTSPTTVTDELYVFDTSSIS